MSEDGAAFDGIAAEYDADFSHSPLGLLLRERLWSVLDAELPQAGHLLELGCGTGEDALHMARRGARVLATDVSAGMLDQIARKARKYGLSAQKSDQLQNIRGGTVSVDAAISTAHLDLAAPALPTDLDAARFDGAWSSFGPLNCINDRQPLWRFLAQRVQPDGVVVLVVMAPLTPWDWLWFGGHGQPRAATRRLHMGGAAANAGAGRQVQVWYPSWRTLANEAAPMFHVKRVEGIGALLPMSEAGHLVARFPRFFGRLARLEARVAGRKPWRTLCDHYALVLRRTSEADRG